MESVEIRKAQQGDELTIHALIVELAVFEKEPNAVVNTPQQLAKDLFQDKICHAFVALNQNKIVGFALYYFSYSTWKGKSVYLEDIYVQPAFRSQKIGNALFNKVVEIARQEKVRRMDWQVLKWNHEAIRFYERKQALLDAEWLNGRLFFEH